MKPRVPERLAQIPSGQVLALKTVTIPPYITTNTTLLGEKDFIIVDPATTDETDRDFLIQIVQERLNLGHQCLGSYLTHHHGDHIAAAPVLKQKFGIPIFAYLHAEASYPFAIDHALKHEQMIPIDKKPVKIFYTPGHASTHVVFYEPTDQTLIAGDMITDLGTILIPPEEGSLKIYLESLLKLCDLPLKHVVPAHGNVIKKDPKKFLLRSVSHRYQRIIGILQVLAKSKAELDIGAITKAIYHGSIDPSLLVFAEVSVMSSLTYLEDKHAVKKNGNAWLLASETEEADIKALVKQIDDRLGYA